MEKHKNFIGGEWVAPTGDQYTEIRNPADTNDIVGYAPRSAAADVDQAIAAAQAAYAAWAGRPAPERGRILYKVANIIEGQIDAWAAELTREEGKTRTEARMEVVRAVEVFRYFAGEAWRVGGDVLPADTTNTLLYSKRVPLGAVRAGGRVRCVHAVELPVVDPGMENGACTGHGKHRCAQTSLRHAAYGAAFDGCTARGWCASWCGQLCHREWRGHW